MSTRRARPPVPANRGYYFGANATRGSVLANPAAYAGGRDPLFGAPTFGSGGFVPSQKTLDRLADAEIDAGWSARRNPVCGTCFTRKAVTGACSCT